MLNTSLKLIFKKLLFVSILLIPSISLADRYSICEDGENCGGGVINGIFSTILIIIFLGFLGFKRAAIFLFVWLAPVIYFFVVGEKGYAAIWGAVGFYLSFFITAWISDLIDGSKQSKCD